MVPVDVNAARAMHLEDRVDGLSSSVARIEGSLKTIKIIGYLMSTSVLGSALVQVLLEVR